MDTQKNCLNEMVLLSTQNIHVLKIMGKKCLQFYTETFDLGIFLSWPIGVTQSQGREKLLTKSAEYVKKIVNYFNPL